MDPAGSAENAPRFPQTLGKALRAFPQDPQARATKKTDQTKGGIFSCALRGNLGSELTTGTYDFDEGGNILSMTGSATDRFRYDRASRLREADLNLVSAAAAQTGTFDVYGNLTQATTNGTGISFTTDTSTNHLHSWREFRVLRCLLRFLFRVAP
jgi:hypothetical protein